MPTKERLLRIAVSHYKSPDVSEAEFHRWAVEEHCAKVARLHAKHKIVAYGMLFSPRSAQEVAQKLNLHLHGRWKIDDHDVQVIFYMRSLEHLTTALADPEFVALQHEETPFVSTSGIVAAFGWEEVYVQDGKVVNLDDEGKPEFAGFHVQADFSDDRFVSA